MTKIDTLDFARIIEHVVVIELPAVDISDRFVNHFSMYLMTLKWVQTNGNNNATNITKYLSFSNVFWSVDSFSKCFCMIDFVFTCLSIFMLQYENKKNCSLKRTFKIKESKKEFTYHCTFDIVMCYFVIDISVVNISSASCNLDDYRISP